MHFGKRLAITAYHLIFQVITDQSKILHVVLLTCGAVLGDVKPDNVLIDTQDDAYIIDFGGGYTRGWVDKELANTAEGDLQGLQRISEFLE